MGARRIPVNFDSTTDLWGVNQGMGVLSCFFSLCCDCGFHFVELPNAGRLTAHDYRSLAFVWRAVALPNIQQGFNWLAQQADWLTHKRG